MNQYGSLKNRYFEFFTQRGYFHQSSSNLLLDDPQLLFTVAGMVQFKDIFLRNVPKTHDRVVTIQKCLRVGGKHNDLDNVGFTKRHNTFFEMMGHFAFYDDNYSKFNIIKDAVDFLLAVGLKIENFWVTIDSQDEESYDIWSQLLDPSRIIKESTGENFWAMGDEGPCGFCTEILYDRQSNSQGLQPLDVLKDSERFLEVWNIVFMSKIRSNGVIRETPGLSIDTGMGLERLLSIIENVDNNFETSAFLPIIKTMESLVPNAPHYVYKICSDHIRSIVFLLAEGLEPSNEKQGYVLKKIIRRAVFYYKNYHNEPLLYKLIGTVQQLMGPFYPEIMVSIEEKLYQEELKILDHLNESENIIKKNTDGSNWISGEKMFFLYDTWGINMAMLEDYAQVNDIQLDYEGFQGAMAQQKFQSGQKVIIKDHLMETKFLGHSNYYDENLDYGAMVMGVYDTQGNPLDQPASTCIVVTDHTWFFPESCGQIGDTGHLMVNGYTIPVVNTLYYPSLGSKVIGHVVDNQQLIGLNNQKITLNVDYGRRLNIGRNHTATHLLNQAFTEIVGPGEQKGSWVGAEKFRWDVGWNRPISNDQVAAMEQLVNEKIQQKIPSIIKDLPLEQAIQEKFCYLKNIYYEPTVRTINIGNWSKELCHGTHVTNTQEIIGFKIVKKRSVSAGVIRLECITGSFMEKPQEQEVKTMEKPMELLEHQGILLALFSKVDLPLYDVYKYQYDFVILLGTNQGIIIGTENHRDRLKLLVDQWKNKWPMKGNGDDRLFRGKIMEQFQWKDIINWFNDIKKFS